MKHRSKVFHTQKLGSHIQGQGHSQGSEVKYFLCDYLNLLKHIASNLAKR